MKKVIQSLATYMVTIVSWLPKSSLVNLRKASRAFYIALEEKLSIRINQKSRFPTSISKLNLGGGQHQIPGFVTLDLAELDYPGIWNYDVSYGLNIESNALHEIYSSHTFEHFLPENILGILSECYRVLRPGGRIRLVVPNIPQMLRAYAKNPLDALELVESHPARDEIVRVMPRFSQEALLPLDCVNFAVYDCGPPMGHKCIFDEETLKWCLEVVGFEGVFFDGFNEDLDFGPHKHTSIYCVALKPPALSQH